MITTSATRKWAALQRMALGLACTLIAMRGWAAPPPPPDPTPRWIPELYVKFELADPARPQFDVQGRIQHATPESLDLVRWDPDASRLPRLEVMLGAEGMILHPRSAEPESYRTLVPRGAPLGYRYTLSPVRADSIPQVWGADHACVWLGSTVLAPRFTRDHATAAGAAAVQRLLVGASLPEHWKLWTPWPQHAGLAHLIDLEDATDNFVGFGIWRSSTEIVRGAVPCTLTTSIAGAFAVADSSWMRIARETLLPLMPERHSGRAWIGIAPGSHARAWIARRSALIVCAPDSVPPSRWTPLTRRTRVP